MPAARSESEGLLGNFANVDHADASELVGRLDTMHALEFFRAYKAETFALMRLAPGSIAADVGCGTGEDARSLAGIVGASGSVTGFDISEAMLKEARGRHADIRNLQFVQSPADALDAPAERFDALRADRVLTHVPDVAAALREIVRVTKPGGRVVISEPDMLGCWVNNTHHATGTRILQAIAHSCASPFAARELYHRFQEAGLTGVRLLLRPVALTDPQAADNILRFGVAIQTMIEKGVLDAGDARLWLEDFEARKASGRFLGGATIFIAVGVKSGAADS